MIAILLVTANMLMIPALEPLPPEAAPMTRGELVALVQLLRDERADHLRKIEILTDQAAIWRQAATSLEATVESLSRLSDIQKVTADARVVLARDACQCPPRWLRRATNGALFGVGVFAGRGVCD